MLEAMAHFAVEPFAAFFSLGATPTSSDRPRLAQAYILHTADGRLIAIHLSSLDKFWDGLVTALEAPELGSDERFSRRQARIENYETLNAELDQRFSRRDLAHWIERLGRHDVPYAPINTIDEGRSRPAGRDAAGLIVPASRDARGGTEAAVRPPVQFGGVRAASVRAAPLLNEHGESIRTALARGEAWPAAARHEKELPASCEDRKALPNKHDRRC